MPSRIPICMLLSMLITAALQTQCGYTSNCFAQSNRFTHVCVMAMHLLMCKFVFLDCMCVMHVYYLGCGWLYYVYACMYNENYKYVMLF